MSPSDSHWVFDQLNQGGQIERSWPLASGLNTVGRMEGCQVRLNDNSVSRVHAHAEVSGHELCIKDNGSRNGVRVNGLVKTQRVILKPEDRVHIGEIELRVRKELHPSPSPASLLPPKLAAPSPKTEPPLDDAEGPRPEDVTLPGVEIDPRIDFQKTTSEYKAILQVCSIVSDGAGDPRSIHLCLEQLVQAFGAKEAHWYPASGDRAESIGVALNNAKPELRIFPFLFKRFQQSNAAQIVPGRDIEKHQKGVGNFNFLVAPLRLPGTGSDACPILLLAREAEWKDFPYTDRTLLELVCQIWLRGQARIKTVECLRAENERLKGRAGMPTLLGHGPAMTALREKARRVAASNATVYVFGENGSGKEVVSHFIHEHSPRRDKPFVKVNIAAIPENMIESELFGHVRGAFTGAVKARKGKFEAANGGTILLDEIGDLPIGVQAKLLRTIEAGEVQPLGAEEVSRVDTRIIAATNRDLRELVGHRQFREDLYHRLDQLRVRIPPLREHLEDIEELASCFLENVCAADGLSDLAFTSDAYAALRDHAWPGNVRELYAVVRRCAFDAVPPVITPEVVRDALRQ